MPTCRLAILPVLNKFTEKNILAQEVAAATHDGNSVHIMSKFIEEYQDLSKAFVFMDNEES